MGAVNGVVLAFQSGVPGELPGPGPWGARQWAGALLYGVLFLAALHAIRLLARDAPADDGAA